MNKRIQCRLDRGHVHLSPIVHDNHTDASRTLMLTVDRFNGAIKWLHDHNIQRDDITWSDLCWALDRI